MPNSGLTEAEREKRERGLRKAANQAWLLIWARYSMIAVVPLGLVVLSGIGWIGAELWSSYKENNRQMMRSIHETGTAIGGIKVEMSGIAGKTNDAIGALRLEMTSAVNELRNAMTMAAGYQNVLNSRIDAQGRRIDQLDVEINQIKERFMNERKGPVR